MLELLMQSFEKQFAHVNVWSVSDIFEASSGYS